MQKVFDPTGSGSQHWFVDSLQNWRNHHRSSWTYPDCLYSTISEMWALLACCMDFFLQTVMHTNSNLLKQSECPTSWAKHLSQTKYNLVRVWTLALPLFIYTVHNLFALKSRPQSLLVIFTLFKHIFFSNHIFHSNKSKQLLHFSHEPTKNSRNWRPSSAPPLPIPRYIALHKK
jgi:hypothetical protein